MGLSFRSTAVVATLLAAGLAWAQPEPAEPEKATRATPTPAEARAAMRSFPASLSAPADSAAREQELGQYALMLQRALSDSLRAHLSYPREALRGGLEGTTRVALRFGSAGVLKEVSVESSSGHAILDQAAMRFVQALVLPSVPSGLRESGFDLSLPISFRLAKPVQAQRQPLPVETPH